MLASGKDKAGVQMWDVRCNYFRINQMFLQKLDNLTSNNSCAGRCNAVDFTENRKSVGNNHLLLKKKGIGKMSAHLKGD